MRGAQLGRKVSKNRVRKFSIHARFSAERHAFVLSTSPAYLDERSSTSSLSKMRVM
jgi:hypothetical protein